LLNQLGLSGDQIKQLTSIQEKSNTDAKAVLTDEQRTKLATINQELETNVHGSLLDLDEPISHSVAVQAAVLFAVSESRE
jgi:hypothetical protein